MHKFKADQDPLWPIFNLKGATPGPLSSGKGEKKAASCEAA
jgi:hypothetical protein